MKKTYRKIVLIGPECTGKTSIAQYLADYYQTIWIPEYAREYVENLNRPYNYLDVLHIARKQSVIERGFESKIHKFLFFDTDLIITKIWFEVVYKNIPKWIEKEILKNQPELYLLCNNDIEWFPERVRENGGEARNYLFNLYKNELENYQFNYKILSGLGQERFNNAINFVNELNF